MGEEGGREGEGERGERGDGGREEGREDEKHEIGKDRYRKPMATFLHTDNVWVVGTCTCIYLL